MYTLEIKANLHIIYVGIYVYLQALIIINGGGYTPIILLVLFYFLIEKKNTEEKMADHLCFFLLSPGCCFPIRDTPTSTTILLSFGIFYAFPMAFVNFFLYSFFFYSNRHSLKAPVNVDCWNYSITNGLSEPSA